MDLVFRLSFPEYETVRQYKEHQLIRDMFPEDVILENWWSRILDGSLINGHDYKWYTRVNNERYRLSGNLDSIRVTTVGITLNGFYEIYWEHNKTGADLVDWIHQIIGKSWATAGMVIDFIEASKRVNMYDKSDPYLSIISHSVGYLSKNRENYMNSTLFRHLTETLCQMIKETPGVSMPWA